MKILVRPRIVVMYFSVYHKTVNIHRRYQMAAMYTQWTVKKTFYFWL